MNIYSIYILYIWLNTTYCIKKINCSTYLYALYSHDTTIQAVITPISTSITWRTIWPITHPRPQATFSATLLLAWSDSEPKCWATALRTLIWRTIQWLNEAKNHITKVVALIICRKNTMAKLGRCMLYMHWKMEMQYVIIYTYIYKNYIQRHAQNVKST